MTTKTRHPKAHLKQSSIIDLFPQIPAPILPPSHGRTLVTNFVSSNPTWALSSLYHYCLTNYGMYLETGEDMKEVFSDACRHYINSLS